MIELLKRLRAESEGSGGGVRVDESSPSAGGGGGARTTPNLSAGNASFDVGARTGYVPPQNVGGGGGTGGQHASHASRAPQHHSGFDSDAAMAEIEAYLKAQGEGYVRSQTGMLESNLNAQLAELEAMLAEAVSQGEISVRDAEAQFEEGKKALEQQNYQDAQRTSAYGEAMGLANSQQMTGLMQGSMQRNQNMINENMSVRDRRINDIQDRLNAITNQKNIHANRAKDDFRTGVMQAEGQAQMMVAQNMTNIKVENFTAHRNQGFAMQQISQQFENDLVKMGIQNANARANATASFNRQMELEQARFEREMSLIDPSTPAGALAAAAEERRFEQELNRNAIATAADAYNSYLLSVPSQRPTEPKNYTATLGQSLNPANHFMNFATDYNRRLTQYDEALSDWKAREAMFNAGANASPFSQQR